MPRPTIFHNPGCSKSRRALALLEERQLDPEVVLYLEDPPTVEDLERLVEQLAIDPAALVRRKDPEALAAAGLGGGLPAGREVLAALSRHPILLERPIVVAGGRAVIGRPPERILEIL